MSLTSPSLGWEKLQDVFYRLREAGQLAWDKDLAASMVSVSSYGTSIAVFPRQTFLNDNVIKSIEIFTGAGSLAHSIPWLNSNGVIVALGWAHDEEYLIVVLEHGVIRCYYNLEGGFTEIGLDLPQDQLVRQAQFFAKGCMVQLSDGQFVSVTGYMKPVVRTLNFVKNPDSVVHGWTVVPPKYGSSLSVLVSLSSSVLRTSAAETTTVADSVHFTLAAVSPNAEFVAVCEGQRLSIHTVGMEHELSVFRSDNTLPARDLKWCGNDAVIIAYDDEVKLVGPSEDSINFYYNHAPVLCTEPDGLRLLTNDRMEFLSRVSDCTAATFKLGSTAASAILLDAIDQLDNHSPKVHENLTIIESNLVEAIDDCIYAATEEFEPYWQKKLLRAAHLGKSNLDAYDPEFYIEVCNSMKILNNIRNPEVGMFLTYQQYTTLGFDRLLQRLLARKLYKLATQIANLLNHPLTPIYIHWACSEIKKSHDINDEDLLAKVLSKLRKVNRISFTEVSQAALEEGREGLATMLIGYEPLPERQIPLLLEIQQDSLAISKAETSGYADIVLYVLTFLKNKLNLAEFFKLVNDKDISVGVLKVLHGSDPDLLRSLYHQQDKELEIADLDIKSFYHGKDVKRSSVDTVLVKIESERKTLVKSLRKYDQYNDLVSEARLIESQIRLLNVMEKLTRDFEMDFYSECKSLNDLVVKLIAMNQLDKVEKLLSKEFKLNDKKMAYLTVDTLISQKNFSKLFEISKSSRSVIGYEYHFEALMKAKQERQASLYVDMCNTTYEKRLKMLFRCHDFKKAAEEAFGKKDIRALTAIHDRGNSVAKRIARGYLEKLGIQVEH